MKGRKEENSQCAPRTALIPPCLNIIPLGTRFLEQESYWTGSDHIQALMPEAMKEKTLPPAGMEGYLLQGQVME